MKILVIYISTKERMTKIVLKLAILYVLIMIINVDSVNNIMLSLYLVNSNFDCKSNGNKLYFIENDNHLIITEE